MIKLAHLATLRASLAFARLQGDRTGIARLVRAIDTIERTATGAAAAKKTPTPTRKEPR